MMMGSSAHARRPAMSAALHTRIRRHTQQVLTQRKAYTALACVVASHSNSRSYAYFSTALCAAAGSELFFRCALAVAHLRKRTVSLSSVAHLGTRGGDCEIGVWWDCFTHSSHFLQTDDAYELDIRRLEWSDYTPCIWGCRSGTARCMGRGIEARVRRRERAIGVGVERGCKPEHQVGEM